MDALESQISQFKAQNMGRLPEQFQSNVAQLQSLQMQLGNTNEALSRLQQSKMQLETQLQNATTQMNYYQSMIEEQVQVAGGNAQTVRNDKLDALNQRMMDAQAGLAAAREKYKSTTRRSRRARRSSPAWRSSSRMSKSGTWNRRPPWRPPTLRRSSGVRIRPR